MKNWTGTYQLDGQLLNEPVEAADLFAASAAFLGMIPKGGSFVTITQDADAVVASATAKLVDLGLSPEEAAAVAGAPASDE